ncbi:MAG: nitroreductase family protein [Clostridiales bacterium]|nr:nitroreductase family protein [Clostridiales bacterium]
METTDKLIRERASVRIYKQQQIEQEKLDCILQSALLAPSAKNCQPWRFVVAQKDKVLIKSIADLMQHSKFVRNADCLVCVFLDKDKGFDYVKDCQSIGACIENMLLTATSLGIGSCWIGEILNRQTEVKELLQVDKDRYELMAIISLGYPLRNSKTKTPRKLLSECVISYK